MSMLSLGRDNCSLIFSNRRLGGSIKQLVRLRKMCKMFREAVDELRVWTELVEELNKMNRHNISPFDNKPFFWLPEIERDENYKQRERAIRGFSREDPRIRRSWSTCKPFRKFIGVVAFSMEYVQHLQGNLPMSKSVWRDNLPWPGSAPPSVVDPPPDIADTVDRIYELWESRDDAGGRFDVFFRLAQLNTAMEDLCRDSGPCWYRVDKGPSHGLTEARGALEPSLDKAIRRFYCCDGEAPRNPLEVQWTGDEWGTDRHLVYLANRRAASDRLWDMLGEDMCERIEVLGEARKKILGILDDIDGIDTSEESESEDSPDSEELWEREEESREREERRQRKIRNTPMFRNLDNATGEAMTDMW
jgi:hypothetical protein